MIEESITESFKKIFDLKKVTFNAPSSSDEQDVLFVNVNETEMSVKDNMLFCKATGVASIYARSDKLPLGYFEKKIQEAPFALTKDFFFYHMDVNEPIMINISKVSFSFVHFFSGQYNPHSDNISSIEFSGG